MGTVPASDVAEDVLCQLVTFRPTLPESAPCQAEAAAGCSSLEAHRGGLGEHCGTRPSWAESLPCLPLSGCLGTQRLLALPSSTVPAPEADPMRGETLDYWCIPVLRLFTWTGHLDS